MQAQKQIHAGQLWQQELNDVILKSCDTTVLKTLPLVVRCKIFRWSVCKHKTIITKMFAFLIVTLGFICSVYSETWTEHENRRVVVWKFSSPVNKCMLKVSNRNTRRKCEICSKLPIKTIKRRQLLFPLKSSETLSDDFRGNRSWRRSGIFIVNFEHISYLSLLFLLSFWTGKCFLGSLFTSVY